MAPPMLVPRTPHLPDAADRREGGRGGGKGGRTTTPSDWTGHPGTPRAGCPRVPSPWAPWGAGPPLICCQLCWPGALQVSSPLWVAAFRLAAGSTAAGEAAPVASCSIPAAGKGREQRDQQRNHPVPTSPPQFHLTTPCPAPRLCHSHASSWHCVTRAGSLCHLEQGGRERTHQRSQGSRGTPFPRALDPHGP